MGAGIAKQIAQRYPKAELIDMHLTRQGDYSKLGTISFATISLPNNPKLTIINAYTQFTIGKDLRIEALRKCFSKIKIVFSGERIGYPAIGSGLAGGNWNDISKIIDEELVDEDHTLVLYK